MPISKASAVWQGGLKGGRGEYKAASGAFGGAYTFATRFEGAPGTTPEELLAAAHAACFSMALAAGLERSGTPPTEIATTASCTFEKVDDAFRATKMHLDTRAKVPGIDQAALETAADAAKDGCPVSHALKGIGTVTVHATLE